MDLPVDFNRPREESQSEILSQRDSFNENFGEPEHWGGFIISPGGVQVGFLYHMHVWAPPPVSHKYTIKPLC